MTRVFEGGMDYAPYNNSRPLRCDVTNRFCGTLGYSAPEVLAGQPYSYPSDVHSLGVVMYEMLYGRPPFHHEDPNEVIRQTLYDLPGIPVDSRFNVLSFHLLSSVSDS